MQPVTSLPARAAAAVLLAVARTCADAASRLENPWAQHAQVEARSAYGLTAPGLPLDHQWRIHLDSFLLWGELCGFGWRDMVGVAVTRDAWDTYTSILQQGGVLVKVRGLGTGYAMRPDGQPWHRAAVRHAMITGTLVLPCPDWPPPGVGVARITPAQAAQHSRRGRPAQLEAHP